SVSGGRPSTDEAWVRSSCRSHASVRAARTLSSSSRLSEPPLRVLGRRGGTSAPRPRARAAATRARVEDSGATATSAVYKVYMRREGYNRVKMPLAAYGVTHQGRRSTNEDRSEEHTS